MGLGSFVTVVPSSLAGGELSKKCAQKQKTHLPCVFLAVGAWASVLRLKCYIPSAPTDTHTPPVQRLQVGAHCCASKIMCTFVNEPCVRVKWFFMDHFHSVLVGESAPHVRFGSLCDRGASRLDRRGGNRSDLQAGQQIRRAPILDFPLPFPLSREAQRIAAYRYRWRGRR